MTRRRFAFWPAVLVALVLATVSALVSTPDVGAARSASQASPLIAFTRPDGVYVMRSDGSGVRLLRRTGSWASWVTWSPDGRKLAFVVTGTKGWLWVMNADGTRPVRLAQMSFASRPTWSPDSRRIAFAAIRDGRSGIWIVNADGWSYLRQFIPENLPGVGPAAVDWSPTGGRLALAQGGWGAPGSGIYVMNTNGGSLRSLPPGRAFGASGEPDWSPDGRRIAFTHASGGEARYEEIWVMDASGGSRVQLTNNHVPDYDPVWSPDGSKIAFVHGDAGPDSGEIYTMNADGTGVTRLTHNHVSEASPSWQPAGRPGPRVVSGVLYQKDPDGTRHVLRVFAPADGGPWPVAVMIHGGEGGPPELPLLNQWAAAVARRGAVVFVPRWPGNPPEPSAKAALAYLTATTGQLACAVRFARAEAKRFGGDPSNLSLFGHSAGASFASEIAFANPKVPAGCVARSGSVVPDNLVLFEGDWLIVSDPVFDDLLQQDPRVMAAITPWSYLPAATRMPVHILDSNDPMLVLPVPKDVGRWLALRDPTGSFRHDLERHGALRDGLLSMQEAQRLLYRRLQSLGYPATFHVLPNSSHTHLSNAGLRILADTILKRT